jgi:glucose dehydrogenase
MDPRTGQVYSATAYDNINATFGVDLKTGRPIKNATKTPLPGETITDICPNADGAKDWQPSAYSPRTHLLYVPHQHLCMNWKTSQAAYIAGTPYVGATVDMYAGPGGYRGEFMAWDLEHHRKVWAIHENFPVWSGALVTGGDVVFYGTMDRWFKAVDARTGQLLWQLQTPSGIIGQPVSYQGSDGRQYVAILCGVGGWPGVVADAQVDPRVRNGALGFTGAMQDLPAFTSGGSTLMVFALPQQGNSATPNPPDTSGVTR